MKLKKVLKRDRENLDLEGAKCSSIRTWAGSVEEFSVVLRWNLEDWDWSNCWSLCTWINSVRFEVLVTVIVLFPHFTQEPNRGLWSVLLVEYFRIDFVLFCGAALLMYLMMCLDGGFDHYCLVCFVWKVCVFVARFA